MTLLQNYLAAVRTFLPRSAEQQDILTELSAHLQMKLEEREEALGRPLTEEEQAAVLSDYGNPVVVAGRYGATNLGLSFGRQLIGPEVFPLYRMVLFAQFALTIVVGTAVDMLGGWYSSSVGRFLWIMGIQFVLTTTIFITIDALKTRSRARATWNFPPAYLQEVPRWQSIGGFVTLSAFALWWSLTPFAPGLLLGPAASRLTFTASWHAFYWPVLVPLLAGAAMRLVIYAKPQWPGLQAVTRLITNSWGLVLVYLFLGASPYVVAVDSADATLAARINSTLWWNSMASLGLYWLINAAFMAYLCYQHATRAIRRRREQLMMEQSTPSW